MKRVVVASAVLLGVVGAACAVPAPIEVIYTKFTGHPTALVPGSIDLAGNSETIEFRDLRDIAISPDGTQWMLRSTQNGALPNAGPDHNDIVMKGSGLAGMMFLQEGQPMPLGGSGWIDFFPSGFGKFNSTNELVLGVRARTAQTLTSSGGSTNPSDGARVFKWSSGSGFVAGPKQGQTYSGTGNTVGNSFSSYHLLDNGTIGAADTTVNGSSTINYLFYSDGTTNTIFKTKNSSTVLDLDGTAVLTWGGFSSVNPTEFFTTPDGAHWFEKGTVQGAATTEDTIWAYDGQVRLREGRVMPGSSPAFTVGDIFQYYAAGNHWIARGRDNSGTTAAAPDFVAVDGVVVAKTGTPITPGSTELWGDVFQSISINSAGDWVVAGNTNNANTALDSVIVMNGTDVIAHEGDMVDMNRNGMQDDDAFLGRTSGSPFDSFDLNITVGRMVYFIGFIKNAAGTELGVSTAFLGPQAFFRIQGPVASVTCCRGTTCITGVPAAACAGVVAGSTATIVSGCSPTNSIATCCYADYDHSGTHSIDDIFIYLNAWFAVSPYAKVGGNGTETPTIDDIFLFLNAWFTGCTP